MLQDHTAVFGKMNDAGSGAVLLLAFIHMSTSDKTFEQSVANRKRGDAAAIDQINQ